MKMQLNNRDFLIYLIAFVLCTVIGTLSHEYGHITIANILGYKTNLHYDSMNYENTELNERLVNIYIQNKTKIENGNDFPNKIEYEKGINKITRDSLLIAIGGPFQTMLTGAIGLCILFERRKKWKNSKLKFIDWLAVFLSLFWLRETFNLVMSLGQAIIISNRNYFNGDEKQISELLHLWSGTVSLVLGVIGLAVSVFIIFIVVPKRTRLTFILSGLIGSISGYILWMNILGPKLIP